MKLLLAEDDDDQLNTIPRDVLVGLIKNFTASTTTDNWGGLVMNVDKISIRVLYLAVKLAGDTGIQLEELKIFYDNFQNDDSVIDAFVKYEVDQIKSVLDPYTIECVGKMGQPVLKFIDLAILPDHPKERFDALFAVKDKWSQHDLNKFFKQIITPDTSLPIFTNKFCRRVQNKNLIEFVLKNTT